MRRIINMVHEHQCKTTAYVNQALLLGWSRDQIDVWAQSQTPPVPASAVQAAIDASLSAWVAAAAADDADVFAKAVARREELYRRAMAATDLKLAHQVLIDLARLQQQYKTEARQAEAKSQADDLVARIRARKGGLRSVR